MVLSCPPDIVGQLNALPSFSLFCSGPILLDVPPVITADLVLAIEFLSPPLITAVIAAISFLFPPLTIDNSPIAVLPFPPPILA